MTALRLTCDRLNGLCRVALWQGATLAGLWMDRLDAPDLTGAIVAARVVRVGRLGRGAFADAGLERRLFIDKAADLRAGEVGLFRLKTTGRGGKAHEATPWPGETPDALGVVAPPLPVWARAIRATPALAGLTFAVAADEEACQSFLAAERPDLLPRLSAASKEGAHPDLDDWLVALRARVVPFAGGGALTIDETEALVAIDVNATDGLNPLAVNLAAAAEIARQIVLRHLSGLIVVDALKMSARADKAKVLNALKRALAHDKTTRVLDLTKAGLVEIVRERQGPSLAEIEAFL
jgi:Ribonuclease G/E